MAKFPTISHKQYALLIADRNTGHVLDFKGNLKLNDAQNIYRVFDSLEEAIYFAKSKIETNKQIECAILNSLNVIVLKIDKMNFANAPERL